MTKKIVYVAELDMDIDDLIAVEYLEKEGLLDYVVLDPYPKTQAGIFRYNKLKNKGIILLSEFPEEAISNVFCGGQLTKIATHIKSGGSIENLVLQGGFVGANIVSANHQLPKFKNKIVKRTFNFNLDVNATDFVFKTKKNEIANIYCVGKNVCHSSLNTEKGLWKDHKYITLFKEYDVRPFKRQHDMLACHEGIAMLKLKENFNPFCSFKAVYPFHKGLNGINTVWGSSLTKTEYRHVISAIEFR